MMSQKKDFCSLIMSELTKLNQNLIVKKIDKETVNVQILTDNEILNVHSWTI